jgi:hypothetical protein
MGGHLGEKLQEISSLIEVDKDAKALQRLKILVQHHSLFLQPHAHRFVVTVSGC